jgi:hypothetical protein
MNKADEAALKLAISMARAEDKGRAEQIDHFLASRPWIEVAQFAAGHCQGLALNLPPWQSPPCDFHGDIEACVQDPDSSPGHRSAAQLLLWMQCCGVSKWHPDPVAACEAAEAKAAAS